jgi:hypothetical protein
MTIGLVLEWLFWLAVVNRRSPLAFGAIASIFSIPFSVSFHLPPYLLWLVFFAVAPFLYPGRYLLNVAKRRMDFWSGYEFYLASYEKQRLRGLESRWWFRPWGGA